MLRLPSAVAFAVGVGLALPAVAPATLSDIGAGLPEAKASCPDRPCLAISRTTGYQAKVGETRGPMIVQKDGRLVSWTISLGKPGDKQIEFFNERLGGKAQARVTVLRFGRKLRARVVEHGPLVDLEPYFGQTVEFALEKSIEVKKGYVVAITVPTWAPALAVNLGNDTSWRASRKKGGCEDTQAQTAQEQGGVPQFYCLYRTARLVYSARVISTP